MSQYIVAYSDGITSSIEAGTVDYGTAGVTFWERENYGGRRKLFVTYQHLIYVRRNLDADDK